MSLILYPTDNWNSFASVQAADIIIGGFVASDGQAAYLAGDEAYKEAILTQTALQIKLCPNISLPDTLESDLELAQSYLVVHALTVDMMSYDANDRAVTKEQVGTLSVEYDANLKGDVSEFDTMTSALLKQYNCQSSKGGWGQSYLGRS